MTAVPSNPAATTGGTGTGATINGNYYLQGYGISNAGSGYVTAPSVTVSGGGGNATSSIASILNLGTSTTSLSSKGAVIDGASVRIALTTAGYTIPTNIDLVRFSQGSTIASATITLPTALGDGQPIQLVNYAGSVTALTFSPPVIGWTNGSVLAANTGIRIRWDATDSSWHKEQ